jgi:N6-adenosine-specific RNA methylase IME4
MHGSLTTTTQPRTMLRMVSDGLRDLKKANDPAEVLEIERRLESIEHAMRATGLFKPEQVREANEGKIKARHKLGRLLAMFVRGTGPGRGKKMSSGWTSFRAYLKQLALNKTIAMDAQRIGAMPEQKLEKVLAQYRGTPDYMTYRELVIHARPFWHQEKRKDTHTRIVKGSKRVLGKLGPFALYYWDPPWTFATHTPEMTHRMPDDHYPVMTDQEIIDIKFNGQSIEQMAHKDCAMFMWCTSSNIKRAIVVMEALGFEYKTHAVWDKGKIGLGLIFRNQHEVLLYGSRGKPPKPVKLFSSVFRYPRGKHSAKPPEIRKILEKMYPRFKEANRVEIFARGEAKGWTVLGHEAAN